MNKGTPYLFSALLLALSACGYYPYYWEVEVEETAYDYGVYDECGSCDDETLYVEVRWSSCETYGCVDLDLELETPQRDVIVAGDEDYYGCTHFGDDNGHGGEGFEEIVCVNPSWGTYDAHVVSFADENAIATVTATYVTGSWSYSEVYDFTETVRVAPWETETVRFGLP